MSVERTPLQYFIGGATGGLFVVLVGHPFDTIKVQLQMAPTVYKNMFHVARTLIAREGPFSLYKGMSAPLLAVVPLSAVGFFSFGAGKWLFSEPGKLKLDNVQLLMSGVFSGICTTVVTAPGERIKCLLQAKERTMGQKRLGFFECAGRLWREGGIRNIYLGTGATLLRDIPAYATYFYSYERLMELFLGPSGHITWQPLLAGGTSGILTWIVSLPADAVKTRIQISRMGTYPRGARTVLPLILKEGSIMTLYRGMVPVLVRAFVANAACFYGLELSFKIMDKIKEWK